MHNAEKASALLCKLIDNDGSILVMEPGNPQGGAFVSALRNALAKKGKYIKSPCVHAEPCPVQDKHRSTKTKWCHFAFDTDAAPLPLRKLSAAAEIPKERATFSFLLTGRPATRPADSKRIDDKAVLTSSYISIRIISDTFPVPSGTGCYGCSEKGLVLVTGNRNKKSELKSGALLNLPLPVNKQYDPKTGALII